jgi:hypothetical protein
MIEIVAARHLALTVYNFDINQLMAKDTRLRELHAVMDETTERLQSDDLGLQGAIASSRG